MTVKHNHQSVTSNKTSKELVASLQELESCMDTLLESLTNGADIAKLERWTDKIDKQENPLLSGTKDPIERKLNVITYG